MSDVLLVDEIRHDHGTTLRMQLHRPEVRNAMDSAMLRALIDALDGVTERTGITGLLLAGDADAFSAGADLREDAGARRMDLFAVLYETLSNFPLPTAAAIEGPAVGGGVEVAAACDLRVAGAEARFRFPGAIHGVPVGPARLIGLVGLGTAKDWVMSSREIGAEEAHRRGFIQRLVASGEAESTAAAWLVEVAGRDGATVEVLKRMLNDFEGVRDRVAWENDALRAHAETGGLPPGSGRDLPRTVRPRRTS